MPAETSATLAGFREAVTPAGAEAESVTVPLNRLILVSVTVEMADEPEAIVRLEGDAEAERATVPAKP